MFANQISLISSYELCELRIEKFSMLFAELYNQLFSGNSYHQIRMKSFSLLIEFIKLLDIIIIAAVYDICSVFRAVAKQLECIFYVFKIFVYIKMVFINVGYHCNIGLNARNDLSYSSASTTAKSAVSNT